MRNWTRVLSSSSFTTPAAIAVVLATASTAAAQPAPPVPAGPPPPAAEPPPVGATAADPVMEPVDTGRPFGLAFGIGLGWALPTSLQTPNVTSVRVRLASGITVEPQLVLATASLSEDSGMTTTNRQTDVTLGALGRYPLRAHRKVDLELIGSAAVATRLTNPEGDDNDRTVVAFDLGYGLGLAYWITPNWNLSLTATNPLVSYARTRQETATVVTVDSITTFGLIFDPGVALMLHLYN